MRLRRWDLQNRLELVREHLRRHVQRRYDDLRLQQRRAEDVYRIRQKIEQQDSLLSELESRGSELAREVGIGPVPAGAPLHRFIDAASRFDELRASHARKIAELQDRAGVSVEQAGESLPLFVHEAFAAGDEDQYAAMARTLSRLADSGRQIFYLSARRHEADLWERATGTAPASIDLATVRFGSAPADPDALRPEIT